MDPVLSILTIVQLENNQDQDHILHIAAARRPSGVTFNNFDSFMSTFA